MCLDFLKPAKIIEKHSHYPVLFLGFKGKMFLECPKILFKMYWTWQSVDEDESKGHFVWEMKFNNILLRKNWVIYD